MKEANGLKFHGASCRILAMTLASSHDERWKFILTLYFRQFLAVFVWIQFRICKKKSMDKTFVNIRRRLTTASHNHYCWSSMYEASCSEKVCQKEDWSRGYKKSMLNSAWNLKCSWVMIKIPVVGISLFMLNSAEHEILNAHKYKNIDCWHFNIYG